MSRMHGELSLPTPRRESRVSLSFLPTLDRRPGAAAGLARSCGIDPAGEGVLRPLPALRKITTAAMPGTPLALTVAGGRVFVLLRQSGVLYLARVEAGGAYSLTTLSNTEPDAPRSFAAFNRYEYPDNPLSGSVRHLLLIYPDRKYVNLDDSSNLSVESMPYPGGMPDIRVACVHASRLFGVAGDRVFASAYNDPFDFNLDTAGDIGAANAWASTVQANARAGGAFTALAVFASHVHLMKADFCHIVNNTKNPFRVADLGAFGTPDPNTLAATDRYLYFAGETSLYAYNGESVREIGAPLGLSSFAGAKGAAAGEKYYLLAGGDLYVYSPAAGGFGTLPQPEGGIAALAPAGERCLFLGADGHVYESGTTPGAWEGETEDLPFGVDAPARLSRLSLSATLAPGSSVSVSLVGQGGEARPLLSLAAPADAAAPVSRRAVSRVHPAAAFAGRLRFAGEGDAVIRDLTLRVSDTES